MTVFWYLDSDRSKTVDANEFLDLVVPRLSAFQENCVLAILYTINHKIQHLGRRRLTPGFTFMELVQAPIGTGPWLRLEPLILRDFLDNSSFYKHPNVQKGNSSEHALILDFKSKMLEFFEFYGINKMDFLEMKRFFEMYIGAWANNDFFWSVASRVFRVKCTSFRKLSELKGVTRSNPGISQGSPDQSRSERTRTPSRVWRWSP